MTIAAFSIWRATAADVPGILDLQARNLPERGGLLSVVFPQAWFEAAIAAMPVIVAKRGGQVLGYLVSAPFSALAQVPIVQAMLRAYPGSAGGYLYGPICVAETERGQGIARAMFTMLRQQLPGREGIAFIRRDNAASLRAHRRMGMREVAEFDHNGAAHVVIAYVG
jgi:L-amino acid N-acyltransferase YncA